MASTAPATVPCAVSTTTSVSGDSARALRSSDMPSSPGILRSVIIK
jgi:hypothetical protein